MAPHVAGATAPRPVTGDGPVGCRRITPSSSLAAATVSSPTA
ncbi:MAG TPA: hypothetical protein VFV67_11660 [Actinophytocola sp.]|nr:hypothetical protein [Actinophytocola sp.]HEU5471302.1 hypothetical protein [Actinophytocola sp.]